MLCVKGKAEVKCPDLLLCLLSLLVQLSDLIHQTLLGVLVGVQRLLEASPQVVQLGLKHGRCVLNTHKQTK